MHLDAAQLEFLHRLGKSPDGKQLLMLINAEIADCNVALRKVSGDALLREQGKAQYLDELVQRLTQPATAPARPKRIPSLSGLPGDY